MRNFEFHMKTITKTKKLLYTHLNSREIITTEITEDTEELRTKTITKTKTPLHSFRERL